MSDSDHRASEARLGPAAHRPAWLPSFGRGRPALWVATLLGSGRVRLATVFEREMEEGRGFLWLPVFFGVGILLYFALSAGTVGADGCPSRSRLGLRHACLPQPRDGVPHPARVGSGGRGARGDQARTDSVAAPMLARETTATVTGWIAGREEAHARRHADSRWADGNLTASSSATGRRWSASRSAARTEWLAVGDAITATVRLQPPSGPVLPGGFDFARAAFYDRHRRDRVRLWRGEARGHRSAAAGDRAAATSRRPPRHHSTARRGGAARRQRSHCRRADHGRPARHIRAACRRTCALPGSGTSSRFPDLHMALVAGSAFWLHPRPAGAVARGSRSTRPIKKWAAAGALAVATFYLGISGGEVATAALLCHARHHADRDPRRPAGH